ncbi:helix-turn-helix protein [Mumia flava]|uniref:Helix-turn-helix protein n=1 Tax=Mumia flava TaxID=1348852 RepID=A0A0B2BL10_9ACTN|nr:helix-turn-helix transcriptional regulator [Mumia flava]PJJ54029.1 helix-turn-helix protein [Mumia flava]
MTLRDRITSVPDGARDLAAARLRCEALKLLHQALEESGMSKTELAAKLGVRKSAVTQVFRGDGNVRVNTLADYLWALGRDADLSLAQRADIPEPLDRS